MKNERRMIPGRVETRALTAEEKAAGYIGALRGIIPLNTDSVELRDRMLNGGRPFVERIAPKAFDGAENVMGMAGHSDATLNAFARQGVNLTIEETANELRYEALIPDTSTGRDLLQLADKKILRGTSFEFERGAQDKWEKRDDGTAIRTVTRGKLVTVNPVIWPAYDDSELTVSMRSRARRDAYFGCNAEYDPTASADVAYAIESLGAEVCELCDALEYLRENPAGAHVAYAQAEVADAQKSIQALSEWLAANGAMVPEALAGRAKEKTEEARAALSTNHSDSDRERRYRIITLSST
jgi:HK97 family phage prohead protease